MAVALPTTTTSRSAPACVLCGSPAVFVGIFISHHQPRRMLAYGLCGGHPMNQATIDQVDELIGQQLGAETN